MEPIEFSDLVEGCRKLTVSLTDPGEFLLDSEEIEALAEALERAKKEMFRRTGK